jgi:ATP-dependent helicase HrpB
VDFPPLPIDAALPELAERLANANAAVLVAPPGAGKTTRVPLALAEADWARDKRILVLEPRRLAARAAAERMATLLGERLGERVGLRVRFGSKVSRRNRVEVVTEGIFTRLILDDPMLEGVAAILFDEFHERSLDADLGLALARDSQLGLREDLKILVMSATIDGARVAKLLDDAPVIASEGRAFPVETRYVGRDARPIEAQVADTVVRALRADTGSLLAFLPGAGEIRRTERLLEGRLDERTDLVPLYGALASDVQDRAILPSPAGRRKVVLATSIAETSITIDGVRIVVDCGLARVPRYEPDVGVTRLETVRVSRAGADQRRGRAGRTEPGLCYRLWDEPQTTALEAFARPEILAADLSSFALDLAAWGAGPDKLAFLDPPPRAALAEAHALLASLGALDGEGRITEAGRQLRRLPLPPRLARMVIEAAALGDGKRAAEIAALISERGLGGDDIDLRGRLAGLRRDRSRRGTEARAMAERWADIAAENAQDNGRAAREPMADSEVGTLLALAFPERIAKNRGGGAGAFLMANGRGAFVDAASALAREPFLAVAEFTGTASAGRILLAAPISLGEIETSFVDAITLRDEIGFDSASLSLRGRRTRRLGAIALSEQPFPVEPSEENARLLAEGIVSIGLDRLPWTDAIRQWRDRVMFLRANEPDVWPDLSDERLGETVADWLVPALSDRTALSGLGAEGLAAALHGCLPWELRRRLEAEAPTHFEAPTGSRVPIDYAATGGPTIAIRVQELFGLANHPSIAGGRVPLVIELLSPAQRPVQTTRDLPGFWRGSYAAVRTEMRGRYPRHPWPDDPIAAAPTRRAKPRKS